MVDNPAYLIRGLHETTSVPPFGEIYNDLYSEISRDNNSIRSGDRCTYQSHTKHCYNAGNRNCEGHYNYNSKIYVKVDNEEEIVKLPNESYEVPISSTYAEMRPISQVPLILKDLRLQTQDAVNAISQNSQIYMKFDPHPKFACEDKMACDTYNIGPFLERPKILK